jgi:uncharacterized protein (TIGR00369 family)
VPSWSNRIGRGIISPPRNRVAAPHTWREKEIRARNASGELTPPHAQDLWDRQRRAAEGNERPGVRPRAGRRHVAAQHDRRTLGYDVTEAANGRVVVTITPTGAHLNPAGTVHGGVAATLLDSAMGLAVQTTLERGLAQTTLEFKISLVRPITPDTGPIKAEGVVLSRGRRIGTAEGRLTDRNGRLLAHGTTTCLIFPSSE